MIRACLRFGIDPWDEYPELDLVRQTDIMLFDAIEHQEESHFRIVLAKIASGLKDLEKQMGKTT